MTTQATTTQAASGAEGDYRDLARDSLSCFHHRAKDQAMSVAVRAGEELPAEPVATFRTSKDESPEAAAIESARDRGRGPKAAPTTRSEQEDAVRG